MTILEKIKKELKKVDKPVKILLSYTAYRTMVDEEDLYGQFCSKCKKFVDLNHDSSHVTIKKEFPIMNILELPFEVSSTVKEVKII